jgi:hypothetical protein
MPKQLKKQNKCSSQSTLSQNGEFVVEYITKTKEVERENTSSSPPKDYQIVKKQLNLF